MAKLPIVATLLLILAVSQPEEVGISRSVVVNFANWISTKIDGALDVIGNYLKTFHLKADHYIEAAREKGRYYRNQTEAKVVEVLHQFVSKYVANRNFSVECVNEIEEAYGKALDDIVDMSNKCIEDVIEGDVDKYNKLAKSGNELVVKLRHHKEEIFNCTSNLEGVNGILVAWNCLKTVGSASGTVIKESFYLDIRFIELLANLAILPAREGYCVGRTVYGRFDEEKENAKVLLEKCAKTNNTGNF